MQVRAGGEAINVAVKGRVILNRTEHIVAAAVLGLGIAFVPKLVARPHLQDGSLRALLIDWCPEYPGLFLYYPGHRHVPASLKAFIASLREAYPMRRPAN